jgi:hypothetical protein
MCVVSQVNDYRRGNGEKVGGCMPQTNIGRICKVISANQKENNTYYYHYY